MACVRHFIGAMTGTSLDGIDLALVALAGAGLGVRARLLRHVHAPLGALTEPLERLARGEPAPAGTWAELAAALGERHAEAAVDLLPALPEGAGLDAACLHGQTLYHQPPLSLQLVNPWPVVRRLGVPVLTDLRGADLAAGGEGAPITPLADWILFRDPGRDRLIVNLGGICNVTRLPAGEGPAAITGADIGPCNLLLDGLFRACFPEGRFDEEGALARTGRLHPGPGAWIAEHPFFAGRGHRSAGRETFDAAWIEELARRARAEGLAPADLLASAVEAVAARIAEHAGDAEPILAGGGARHRLLAERVAARCRRPPRLADALGIPAEAREAVAMAVLAALAADGEPVTLPAVTGAAEANVPPAGSWSGGRPPASAAAPGAAQAAAGAAVAGPGRGARSTEGRLAASAGLDGLSAEAIAHVIAGEDAKVPPVVRGAIDRIGPLAEAVAARLRAGGRLVSAGAGTSGRLAVLDASECPPTFHADPEQVVGLIAGGDAALRRSIEGAEDDADGARGDFERLRVGPADLVLGVMAGGTTPWVWGALELARARGAGTALITCAEPGELPAAAKHLEHRVCLPTGPEVVTGSTRMKAGTATKLALNMISTIAMVRLGKVWGHLMVDLVPSNAKLRDRALRILVEQLEIDRPEAARRLEAAGGHVKIAILMHRLGLGRAEAEARLEAAGGRLTPLVGPPRG